MPERPDYAVEVARSRQAQGLDVAVPDHIRAAVAALLSTSPPALAYVGAAGRSTMRPPDDKRRPVREPDGAQDPRAEGVGSRVPNGSDSEPDTVDRSAVAR